MEVPPAAIVSARVCTWSAAAAGADVVAAGEAAIDAASCPRSTLPDVAQPATASGAAVFSGAAVADPQPGWCTATAV